MTENPNHRQCVVTVGAMVMQRDRWKNTAKKRGMTLEEHIRACLEDYEMLGPRPVRQAMVVVYDPKDREAK